jgi:hypothetical protein
MQKHECGCRPRCSAFSIAHGRHTRIAWPTLVSFIIPSSLTIKDVFTVIANFKGKVLKNKKSPLGSSPACTGRGLAQGTVI